MLSEYPIQITKDNLIQFYSDKQKDILSLFHKNLLPNKNEQNVFVVEIAYCMTFKMGNKNAFI